MNIPELFEAIPREVTEEGVKVETVEARGRVSEILELSASGTGREAFESAIDERITIERYKHRAETLFRPIKETS